MATIESQLTEFLAEELDLEEDELDPKASLFDSGLLDSVAVLSIVAFIEEEWDVEFDAQEVNLANFDTLGDMVRLVQAKVG